MKRRNCRGIYRLRGGEVEVVRVKRKKKKAVKEGVK